MSSKTFLKKMKETLLNEKNELMKRATAQVAGPDVDVDMDGDETDEIQAKILIETQKALVSRALNKVTAIDNALQRIEDKTYGVCEDCGEDIPEKRLTANPHFLTCVGCAEDKEVEERQRKRA
jgi:RNA polymerase-binding transcription factor